MSAFFQGHEIHRGRPCQVINGRNWRMDIARQSATHKWMFHFRLSKRTNSTREAHLYLFINNEFLARETTGGLPGIMRAPGPRSLQRAARPGMVRHRRHSLPSLRFKMHHHPSEGAQCRGFYSWTQREGFFFLLRRMSPQPAQRGFSEVRKQTPPRKENRTWPLVSR